MSANDAELLKLFSDETRDHLTQLETDLLTMEQYPTDSDLINSIFRAVHSIKGSAGFFGFKPINDLSHAMEDLMVKVREGKRVIVQDIIDVLLSSKDKLNQMLDNLDRCANVDCSVEKKALKGFLETAQSTPPPPPPPPQETEPVVIEKLLTRPLFAFPITQENLEHTSKGGRFLYMLTVDLKTHVTLKNKTLTNFYDTIKSLGALVDPRTSDDIIKDMQQCVLKGCSWITLYATVLEPELVCMGLELQPDQIEAVARHQWDILIDADGIVAPTPSAPLTPETAPLPLHEEPHMLTTAQPKDLEPATSSPEAVAPAVKADSPRAAGGETIRVSVSLLDDLMNLAGEMVLGRNQLLRMAGGLAKDVSGLYGLLQNINLVTSELQEKVMHTRMQPVDTVFSKFPRIIRDMSKKLGKEIDLKMLGEDVELDKSIIESLSDPLTHLIRNCADHAIESPAEREKNHKARIGSVKLSAFHEGGQVHIEIADDGRGIDPERIRKKAVEKGFLKLEDAAKLTERETLALIFLPGFSTAEKITDVSGRGVGMDVVKTNIEKLGGSVEIESDMGVGTRVRLRLPLTLAIIPSMVIMAGNRRFAVPQVSLEELVRLDDRVTTERVRGVTVMRLRGTLLPLVNLTELLGIRAVEPARALLPGHTAAAPGGSVPPSAGAGSSELPAPAPSVVIGQDTPLSSYVLVLKTGTHRYGLRVDALIDSEEIVVKPLCSYLKKCKCYSGSTIMGDGKVAMILDAAGIAEYSKLRFADLEKEANARRDGEEAKAKTGESQLLLLFNNATHEQFALNLAMINRIEKVRVSDIQRIGGREYLKFREQSLRIIRMHDFMPITKPTEDPDALYVIIPKMVKHPMGIVATRINDVMELSLVLDRRNITGAGILGSAVINENLTVFLDIYELFEAAEPEVYGWKKSAESLTGKRILLAEDTAFFRTVEKDYLSEFGCHVDAVPDGVQAWDRLNHQSYDMLLTDIEMPGMNGYELVQRVRASDKLRHLPVIALTSLTADKNVTRGKDAGVDAYESKLDKERLRDTLERVLHDKEQPEA